MEGALLFAFVKCVGQSYHRQYASRPKSCEMAKRRSQNQSGCFDPTWESDYLFVESDYLFVENTAPQCLVCGRSMHYCKKFNLKRHYKTLHEQEYKSV